MTMINWKEIRLYRHFRRWRNKGIRWVSKQIAPRNYEIIVSIIIGIVAGLVAVLLKSSVNAVRGWMHGQNPSDEQWALAIFPLVGIALTIVYARFFLHKPIEAGLSSLIYAISLKKVNLPRSETYSHVISSSLTVGFGGSVGLEAPIIRTGSAIGSNLARILRVGRRKQTLFLACGAAAGMAAIFNSPVAGVIFAFEVLVTDIALASFIPLLISAATGAVIARMLYYEQLFFLPTYDWKLEALPFYLLIGVLCGLLSVYMIRTVLGLSDYFNQPDKKWRRMAAGGLALGVMIFLMPPLFGEGYDTVRKLLGGNFSNLADHSPFHLLSGNTAFMIAFAVAILLAKALASALTIALGGSGGVFAPSMFTGAMFGFVFAYCLNLTGWVQLSEANFIAVGMGGLLSGVFKSPLTGIFLIAEITGGYNLFVPLMIVSALSYFTAIYFEPHSIFTRELFLKGLWAPSHERDLSILKNMDIQSLIETNFYSVFPATTLREFVEVIAKSRRNVFPVVDEEGLLQGIVLLDDVREVMFQSEMYDQLTVRDIMHNPPATVDLNEPMNKVMNKFEYHNAWNLPVVDNGRYVGFVSKSSIFNRYRQSLIDKSD
jgi:chloride channel protein, CIC family